jgi:hypothetical protein
MEALGYVDYHYMKFDLIDYNQPENNDGGIKSPVRGI